MSIIPNSNKLKILCLSDHPHIYSGVGRVTDRISRAFMKEGWEVVHIGALVKPPNTNPIVDDIGRKIYPFDGYGDIHFLRELIKHEKPDILWFMTDPRYFIWLWSFEDEIRVKMPMIYYHVWDNLPVPKYNYDYYNSCDSIFCISKLTYDIVKQCKEETKGQFNVLYCQHGINIDVFKPLDWNEKFDNIIEVEQWQRDGADKDKKPPQIDLYKFADRLKQTAKDWNKDPEGINFIVFWSNKNMRRKNMISVMEAFYKFAQNKNDVLLLMHTEIVSEHGTDLQVVRDTLFNNVPIILFQHRIPEEELVRFYNISACTLNIASAEGFGLSSLESLACGIPIINNMTGGLQDQIYYHKKGFCGIPIVPAAKTLVGSPPTPYIADDYVNVDDVANALEEMYKYFMSSRKRNPQIQDQNKYDKWCENARENVLENFNTKDMEQLHVDEIKRLCLEWIPRKKYVIKEI